MKFIADLHLHSKYSRATARNLDFESLYHTAQLKGVSVIGTGDFTHPFWVQEIESKLEEAEPGLFALKKDLADPIDQIVPERCKGTVRFVLQAEISNIYKKNDRVRKNHNLVYFPDLASVKKFNTILDGIGNITSDGRPILGLDAKKLLQIMLEVNDSGMFIPAHIWTPWFSLFGSKSGFDSMVDCFEDLTEQIFAVETGLSSDPPMNWRIKQLDNCRLISSSDAHSPGMLGRNASVFNTDLSYQAIYQALKTNDLEAFQGTLDMFPHQGKYHYDGHRKCNICLNPATTSRIGGICPECGRPVTLGVLYRVQELACRPEGYQPENRHGFRNIIPLTDILSEIFGVGPKTKKVAGWYDKSVDSLGPELDILLERSLEEIKAASIPLLAQAVEKMRKGSINIEPGYDGEYGVVKLFSDEERKTLFGEKDFLFKLPKEKSSARRKKAPGLNRKASPGKKPALIRPQVPKDILSGLNPDQKKAVETSAQAVIVKAGPGTGKTRTLTAKIAWLVSKQKKDPASILALTFTNKAAKELEKRIESFLPKGEGKILAATFHAFCLSLLKTHQPDFTAAVIDDQARVEFIGRALGDGAKKSRIKEMGRLISTCKQQLIHFNDNLEDIVPESDETDFRNAYQQYQAICAQENKIDFEDLIFKTVDLFRQQPEVLKKVNSRYRYVFIDEYQDLNHGQYVLSTLLAKDNHLFVIGDPDQSIYGFRGSDNKYFKRFETDFPECERIYLKQNYRSCRTILDASFQMISKSGDNRSGERVYSDLEGVKQILVKPVATHAAEAVAIGKMIEKLMGGMSFFSVDSGRAGLEGQREYSFADFAILVRTQKQCDIFMEIFDKEGIPYQTADKKKLFEMEGIRQLVSMARTVSGSDIAQDKKILADWFKTSSSGTFEEQKVILTDRLAGSDSSTCIRQISKTLGLMELIDKTAVSRQAFERMLSAAEQYPDMTDCLNALALNLDADTLPEGTEKVSLMTMHAAKGLEFKVVFVAGCEQGFIPYARDLKHVDNPEEERRLFYVAMTRAMDILCLTYTEKRQIYGTVVDRQPSVFIKDIEAQLMQVEKNSPRTRRIAKKQVQLELF